MTKDIEDYKLGKLYKAVVRRICLHTMYNQEYNIDTRHLKGRISVSVRIGYKGNKTMFHVDYKDYLDKTNIVIVREKEDGRLQYNVRYYYPYENYCPEQKLYYLIQNLMQMYPKCNFNKLK